MRWAAFKYGPVLLIHLLIIFIYCNVSDVYESSTLWQGKNISVQSKGVLLNLQQHPSLMIGSWSSIVNNIEAKDLWTTEPCKLTSSLMFSLLLEFCKNHDRKTDQSTTGIRGTANAQATSTGL